MGLVERLADMTDDDRERHRVKSEIERAVDSAQQWYDRCFAEWSSLRSPANAARLAAAKERLEAAEERFAANQAAGSAIKKKVEAAKAAKQAEADAKFDAEVEPIRLRRMREWLVDHPDKTEADFMRQAWPLIRQSLLEDANASLYEKARERLRRSGKYVM